jgi:outer membrane protein
LRLTPLCVFALASALSLSQSTGQPPMATPAPATPPAQAPQGPVLTLAQALEMAREQNGDVRSAIMSTRSAQAGVAGAKANFYPNITPSYNYNSSRNQVNNPTGPGTFFNQTEGGVTQVNATLRVLDLGERQYSLKSAVANADASKQDQLQTLRQVLFQVYSQYYNTLRGQELVTAAQAQVQRTQSIYDATQAEVQVGQVAKKDLLQAQADLANARVAQFSAENTLSSAQASLKALIGWDQSKPLPSLVASQPPTSAPVLPTLDDMIAAGMQNRADILAARKRNDSLHYSTLLAERRSQASLAVDATYGQEITPTSLQDRSFTLSLSLPWLDFGRSKAAARQSEYDYKASEASLVQTERTAQSEIEAAYQDVKQNAERLTAAQQAIDAAQLNYDAAAESQKLGVSTIIDVITAQASLATAQSDYIQALYDYETSVVNLRLVTGQSIPGETPATP